MFDQTKMIATAAILTGLFFAPVGSANDLELLATTIPASACRPKYDSTDALVKLQSGAFIFREGQTGTASLLCPLPLNGWQVSVPFINQFADPEMNMTSYRIYFKDSNRCLSSVNLRARLRYRDVNSMKAVAPSWTSDLGGPICVPPHGSQQNTSEVVPLVATLIPGRLYSITLR